MQGAGNDLLGRQQPFDEIDQSIYAVGGDEVSIKVIEPSGLDSPDVGGLVEVVAPGMALIVQVYFPSYPNRDVNNHRRR